MRHLEETGNNTPSLNIKKRQNGQKNGYLEIKMRLKKKNGQDFYSLYRCTFSWETQKWQKIFKILRERESGAQKMAPP